MLKKLLENNIVKNFMVLLSGAVIAQALPALFSPIISRIYSPSDFANFAYWSSIANTVAVVSTLRYELAIVLPKNNEDAKQILKGSMLLSLITSVLTFLFCIIFITKNDNSNFSSLFFSFLIASYVLVVGINQSISYWLIRHQQFKKTSLNKVIQSVSLVVITLLFGFFTIGGGLIYAYLIGGACLCIFSFWQIREAEINFKSFNFLLIKEQLVNYKNYPIYNAVPSLLNAASSALPVFFVVNYFSSNESGQFAFVKQNITVPIMYLAALISQVYFADIANDIKEGKSIKLKLLNLFKILAVFSFIISITLVLFGEEIFEFVFGSNWILAGKVAGIIVLSTAVQLIVSPLSITLIALDKIKILSIWQLSYFLAIAMLYFFRKLVFTDFLTLTTIMEVIAFIVYSYLIMREVNNYEKRLYLPIT